MFRRVFLSLRFDCGGHQLDGFEVERAKQCIADTFGAQTVSLGLGKTCSRFVFLSGVGLAGLLT